MMEVLTFALVFAWAAWSFVTIRRRRLARLPEVAARPAGAPEPIVFLFAGASVWLAGAFGGALAFVALGEPTPETELAHTATVGGAAQGASLAMAFGLLVFRPALARRVSGIGAVVERRALVRGLIAFVLIVPFVLLTAYAGQQLAGLIAELTGGDPPDRLAHGTLRQLSDPELMSYVSWWAIIAVVTIGAPISEEIIFRGFAQTALTRMTGSHRYGIALTTVLFVLVHIGIASPQALIPLTVLSVGLSVCYAKTGSVWAPIVVHAGFNGMNVVMALAG